MQPQNVPSESLPTPPLSPPSPPAVPEGPADQPNPPLGPLPPMPDPNAPKPKRRWSMIAASIILILIGAAAAVTLAVSHHSRNTATESGKSTAHNSSPATARQQSVPTDSGSQYARDTKRMTDLDGLQTQLEAFFENTGYYPSLTDMNNTSWRDKNMKNLNPYTMVDPLSSCDPLKTACLVATPKTGSYAYMVTDSKGASCESDDTGCAKYTLTATLEYRDNGRTFTKSNLD